MKEQNTGEVDALIDVLDGWNHNDAKQVLDAVRLAKDGKLTQDEMLNGLIEVTGGFKEHIDEREDGKIIKGERRFITFYVAMDEHYDYEAAADDGMVADNLSGMYRIVKFTGWMARPTIPTAAEIVIPDDAGDTVNVEA